MSPSAVLFSYFQGVDLKQTGMKKSKDEWSVGGMAFGFLQHDVLHVITRAASAVW